MLSGSQPFALTVSLPSMFAGFALPGGFLYFSLALWD